MKTISEDNRLHKDDMSGQFDFERCGGRTTENTIFCNLPAVNERDVKFVSYYQVDQQISTSLQVFLQIVAENVNKDSIKVVGIKNNPTENSVFDEIKNIGANIYGVSISYAEFNLDDLSSTRYSGSSLKSADLAIVRNLSTDDYMCQMLHFVLHRDSFIVSEEDNMFGGRVRPASLFRKVAAHSNASSRLDLVRWRPTEEAVPTTAITVHANVELSFLTAVRANLSLHHRLLIITSYPASSALKQLVRCWRKDKQRNNVLLVTINIEEGHNFFLDDLPDIDLAFAVLDHGMWGGEYYVPAKESPRVSSRYNSRSGSEEEVVSP